MLTYSFLLYMNSFKPVGSLPARNHGAKVDRCFYPEVQAETDYVGFKTRAKGLQVLAPAGFAPKFFLALAKLTNSALFPGGYTTPSPLAHWPTRKR